jgi:hypothetical protein
MIRLRPSDAVARLSALHLCRQFRRVRAVDQQTWKHSRLQIEARPPTPSLPWPPLATTRVLASGSYEPRAITMRLADQHTTMASIHQT